MATAGRLAGRLGKVEDAAGVTFNVARYPDPEDLSEDDLTLVLFDLSVMHNARELLRDIEESEVSVQQEKGACERLVRGLPSELLRTVSRLVREHTGRSLNAAINLLRTHGKLKWVPPETLHLVMFELRKRIREGATA